jgi:hypothetical protein
MDIIEKLNKIISRIEDLKNKEKIKSGVYFDDLDLNNLDIEIVVGSKVNIQSPDNKINLGKDLLLENYLKSISNYRKYRDFSPKPIFTDDLNLDINLEINQKFLVEKDRLKKTPEDIKRNNDICL